MNFSKYPMILLLMVATSISGVVLNSNAQENSLTDEYILMKAVKDRDYAKIRSQLQKGANVNTRDFTSGETPLYLAASMKDAVAATFLLNEKANTDIATLSGETPLMAAVRLRAKEIVDMLLSQNADVNISDRGGETALYKAVRLRDRTMVKTLLDAQADWSIADHTGRTPLDVAREDPRLRSMIRVLEAAGAEY